VFDQRNFLKILRLTHLYLGVFIAPSLLFFSFTGALQTFSFHQAAKGSSVQPPNWIVILAQIHKNQTTVLPERKQKLASVVPDSKAHPTDVPVAAAPKSRTYHPLPLKIFFLVVSVGLLMSTLIGLYMAYRYNRDVRLITVVLFAGTMIPSLFALL
jgi:hypothetical protein